MDEARWRQVEAVVQAALAVPADRRDALVAERCAGDTDLRREVESLLAAPGQAGDLLVRPAWQEAASAIAGGSESGAAQAGLAEPSPPRVTLTGGSRLGPYEVVQRLGAGGMGEVYEARDTRIGRTVAVKVLPPELARDPDRHRWFEREARAISALNHPHICAIYDLGDALPSGPGDQPGELLRVSFLVLEYVAGRTLAARLAKGRLSLALALEIGAQIAEALGAAHRHGIVHRDLKPANVMLADSDQAASSGGGPVHVKLLDFGLAKLFDPEGAHPAGPTPAAADSLLTQSGRGMRAGTPAYMAPEQVEGRAVDRRTDLWALGVVLYEMLTGVRPFPGETPTRIAAAVLERDPPPITGQRPETPPALDRLVMKCLAKDPLARWQDAGDVADELRWIARETGRSASGAAGTSERSAGRRRRRAAALAAAVLALVATGAGLGWRFGPGAGPTAPVVRALIDTRPADGLGGPYPSERMMGLNRPSRTAIALSPDGRTLVFGGVRQNRQQLFRRRLDEDEAVPLDGTEGASNPFFSPDGAWIAYWARGALWKLPVTGGASTRLRSLIAISGASWGRKGTIAVALQLQHSGITVMRAGDGETVAVLEPDRSGREQAYYAHPHFLPDGETLTFTRVHDYWTPESAAAVFAYSPRTGGRVKLVDGAMDARYVGTGHLTYLKMARLLARRFDPDRLALDGDERTLLPDVMQALNAHSGYVDTGAGQIAVSDTGTLVYVRGGMIPEWQNRLVWLTRTGSMADVEGLPPGPYSFPRLSPDGRRLLYTTTRPGAGSSLWLYDLARRVPTLLPTGDPPVDPRLPVWSPDGRRATFSARANGQMRLHVLDLEGGVPPAIVPGDAPQDVGEFTGSWTPDGREMVYTRRSDQGAPDELWRLRLEGDRTTREFLVRAPGGTGNASGEFGSRRITYPAISPDGRWLAWTSNETGTNEVYVARYPGLEGQRRLSNDGGRAPRWRSDRRELFYMTTSLPAKLMVVEPPRGHGAAWGPPRVLCEIPRPLHLATDYIPAYDVAPDGQRFLFLRRYADTPPPPPSEMHVVINWFEALRSQMGAK